MPNQVWLGVVFKYPPISYLQWAKYDDSRYKIFKKNENAWKYNNNNNNNNKNNINNNNNNNDNNNDNNSNSNNNNSNNNNNNNNNDNSDNTLLVLKL